MAVSYAGAMIELHSWRSCKAFIDRLLHLVRANRREHADALLGTQIVHVPAEFAIPVTRAVEIGGWDELLEGFVEADDLFASRGERLAVVALDLVNRRQFGSKDGRYPERDEVHLEARFYGEPPEQRARDCPRRLLNAPQRTHAQYLWRRRAQCPSILTLSGIEALGHFQRRLGPPGLGENPKRERAKFLAGWLLWLRTEQAVAHTVARRGLPRAMPVIFGVDSEDRPMEVNAWDYGPTAESLHLAPAAPLTDEQRAQFQAARRQASGGGRSHAERARGVPRKS